MDEIPEQNVEKSDWNFKQSFGYIASKHLEAAGNYYSTGKLTPAFQNLKAIRMLVVFKLSQEEIKDCEKQEDSLVSYTSSLHYMKNFLEMNSAMSLSQIAPQNWTSEAKQSAKIIAKNFGNRLFEKYYQTIMNLLNKYGFLVGTKEDDSEIGYD